MSVAMATENTASWVEAKIIGDIQLLWLKMERKKTFKIKSVFEACYSAIGCYYVMHKDYFPVLLASLIKKMEGKSV